MSAQPSLLTKADDDQVLLPSNNNQVQVVRDKAAFGLGKFWAYFKNGTKELIGNAGAPAFNFSVAITGDENNLTATPSVGAVGDYTYAWAHSDVVNTGGTIILTFPSTVFPDDPNKAQIDPSVVDTDCYAMIVCTVTHIASGTIKQAYVFVKIRSGF